MERIVAIRLKVYVESVSMQDVAPYLPIYELTELTSTAFVARQINLDCEGF
jgi:hypothetical protein